MLSFLRHTDYKKYEWLLEKLNIVYKPLPFEPEKLKRKVHQVYMLCSFSEIILQLIPRISGTNNRPLV